MKYDFTAIENKWQKRWEEEKLYRPRPVLTKKSSTP